ncbi:MAG TPA: hypothetical protein IAA88_07760 [Candidatus Avimuribaculum pullicola]|nr:hypothetical protein [Candidatus Avimuribaculum pullicola]
MKRSFLFFAVIALMCLAACNGNKTDNTGNDSIVAQLNDSLLIANAEKDSLLSLINDINEGMMQIRDMEKIISASNLNAETPNKKQQIMDNMALIQQALQDRREKLAALERRLKNSSGNSSQLQETIDGLKKQLEEQQATINQLTEELRKAHIEIQSLNTTVDSLNVANQTIAEQKEEAEVKSEQLANELNTCYYVIGSKSELKEHKIIETGFLRKTKVMEKDYEIEYFTKGDKRTLAEIPLYSKKAKIYTKHPADSYEIVTADDNTKTIVITNPTKFWELSNFLVVQID